MARRRGFGRPSKSSAGLVTKLTFQMADGSALAIPPGYRVQCVAKGTRTMTERTHGLEHGLTNYGDRDFSLYLRRSFAQSMGYSRAMLGKPVVGIAYTRVGLQQLPPPFPGAAGGGQARRAGGRRAADRVSDHLARRGVPEPDQPQIPQPDVDRHRGDDPRPADGRGGADGRLRQDRAGAADGRGLGRPAGDHAGGGPDDDRAVIAASGSAPAPIAAASGRAIAPARSTTTRSRRSKASSRSPPAPAR